MSGSNNPFLEIEQILKRPQVSPQKLEQAAQNCELLRLCFNTLNAVIRESHGKRLDGMEHCNVFTLVAATKIIYERWEQEKRKLNPLPPPSTDFHPPAPLPEPELPDYLRETIARDVKKSAFFQSVWGKM